MNEKQTTSQPAVVRPTKRQRELLTYIASFIAAHGYSPSYREIMAGLQYSSVATVALHVNGLIKRGHLRKRDYSARSLELTNPETGKNVTTNQVSPTDERWIVEKVEHAVQQAELAGAAVTEQAIGDITVLVEALRVLGLEAAAQSFVPRLASLRQAIR